MKNKKMSLILALVIIFQFVLIISSPVYESIVFSRCEKYGREYKIEVDSLQIDIFDPGYRENRLYINLRNNFGIYMGEIEKNIGFMLNDEGFCVFDLYGKNKDKHVDSVKREFLYGGSHQEGSLIFSEGVTLQSIAEYLEGKTGEENWSGYHYFDFLSSYGIEVYITVKVYGGIMTKEALYIDGAKVLEFR